MLASLLFPYDGDVPSLIDGWLLELEQEGCLVRYQADGSAYIEICKWLNHQKIDKPSQSKIPPFDESSRILANPRESYPLDQGSKDQGKEGKGMGKDQESTPIPSARYDPLKIYLPDCVNPSAWSQWIDYRRKRKLTCAEPTMLAQIKNLETWWHNGHDPGAVIRESIANGWQGLFEPKQKTVEQSKQNQRQSNVDLAYRLAAKLNGGKNAAE
jgi:hypothetical protein